MVTEPLDVRALLEEARDVEEDPADKGRTYVPQGAPA
jgi:hypothetical protein